MTRVDAAQPLEVLLCAKSSETQWLTHGARWAPTVGKGPGQTLYLRITNSLVTVGSLRYTEWQNLVFQVVTDEQDGLEDQNEESSEPLIDRPQYDPPMGILKHLGSQPAVISQIAKLSNPKEAEDTDEEPVEAQITLVDKSGSQNTERTRRASEPNSSYNTWRARLWSCPK
ncbi:hypothetical protein PI124_g20254 [Phytophthora idaei]|nr:hypothetical protein PI124_g20254 [Phytophthora idaei]